MSYDDIDLFLTPPEAITGEPPVGHDGDLMNACFAVVAVLFVGLSAIVVAIVAWAVGQ